MWAETVMPGVEIPLPPEPDDDGPPPPTPLRRNGSRTGSAASDKDDGPTTWEPMALGPWLSGEQRRPEPTIGLARSDGQRLLYPGREHAVVGETESGKTWFALACVAAELAAGRHVVYLHYEESDPGSTVERLALLGISPEVMVQRLRFAAPLRPARDDWLRALLTPAPSLVVHDGVNEAMSLHGADIMAADGAATFRRRLIVPCLRAGAATLACDHVPKSVEGRGRDAYGSVHKGNAIDGARFVLENSEPFGRGLRGVSHVFVTKDRPGHLRAHGKPSKVTGRTYFATLVVDDGPESGPDFLALYAPADDDRPPEQTGASAGELTDTVHAVIAALPEESVGSLRALFAEMRNAGHLFREHAVRNAVDDLLATGRLAEVPGKRGALGYRAVLTAARSESESDCCPGLLPTTAAPKRRGSGQQSQQECGPSAGSSGQQWAAVEKDYPTQTPDPPAIDAEEDN
jgi:hypothetical protein